MVLGDELADFGRFYERTYPAAVRLAYGIVGEQGLADDVAQDAYVAAFRARDGFRGDGPADAWLYRIVVNAAISALRRRRIRVIEPLPAALPDRPDGPDGIASSIDRVVLADGLRRLDPRARSAIVLRYYLDLDYAAIGSILGTSADNVGAILSRSLDRLRPILEPEPSPAVPAAVPPKAVPHG